MEMREEVEFYHQVKVAGDEGKVESVELLLSSLVLRLLLLLCFRLLILNTFVLDKKDQQKILLCIY